MPSEKFKISNYSYLNLHFQHIVHGMESMAFKSQQDLLDRLAKLDDPDTLTTKEWEEFEYKLEEIPGFDSLMKEARKKAYEAAYKAADRTDYEGYRKIGFIEGYRKGYLLGCISSTIKFVHQLKAYGLPLDMIVNVTGLSKEGIQAL